MVMFVCSQPQDMRTFFIETDGFPEISFNPGPTELRIVKQNSVFIARGTGFTYTPDGAWTGGTVAEMEESRNGSLGWKLTGASYSTVAIESYYDDSTDELLVRDLMAFFFAGNDSIVGSTGNDYLTGLAGRDTLRGGGGTDTMLGGTGNDLYVVDSAGDLTVESSTVASEIDTVLSTVSRTLGANLERLTLIGSAAINGTGNTLANLLTGNAAANALSGGAGNDTLNGGAGNDTLNGGTGIDSMTGGDGSDTYVIDSTADRVVETGTVSSSADSVQSSVSWALGTGVERLTLTGTATINGTGNTLANVLTGNAAANVLSGGSGNDTLSGGSGNDILLGGAGNDALNGGAGRDSLRFNTTLNASTNVDRITGFVAADDTIQIDDAVFAGIGPTGVLGATAFRAGTAAGDANDRIVYDSATGRLWFDADGTGAGTAVLFATLTAGTALSAADFMII